MKLYLVERADRVGYDEYDAFVVAAEHMPQARDIARARASECGWPLDTSVNVKAVGTAFSDQKAEIILGSFNAG